MQTHRAYFDADTEIVCWVRDDAGARDLTAGTLTARVMAYGQSAELCSFAAAQAAADDAVRFTVTADATSRYLSVGLYRFEVRTEDGVVYAGLLEVA